MRTVSKSIDINAYIENLRWDVENVNGESVAKISFNNLGKGVITAIKFIAHAYNSFDDIVQVNGKDNFFLIIQDVSIPKNEIARDLKAKLPDSAIKKLKLVVSQICYEGGSVATYEGEDIREFTIEEYDINNLSEKKKIQALRYKFGEQYKYKILDFDSGWICGCGRYNISGSNTCSNCKSLRDEQLKYLDESALEGLISLYEKAEEQRIEAQNNEAAVKEKAQKRRKIKIALGAVVGIIIAIFIVHASIMAGRTTFSSESEMKSAVSGTYTHYEGQKARYQLYIEGDTIIKRWVNLGSDHDMYLKVNKWNPKKGTFEISLGAIVVTNTGALKHDGVVYEKRGSWAASLPRESYFSSYSSSSSSENGASVLKISNVSIKNNSSYTVCTGSLKNTGTKTYKYVEVKGAFKDSQGNVIDTDWTYAVGSEGLEPDESTTFRLSVEKNSNIKDCSVSVLDYD